MSGNQVQKYNFAQIGIVTFAEFLTPASVEKQKTATNLTCGCMTSVF